MIMHIEATRKVLEWRRAVNSTSPVKLHHAIDLTIHPSSVRATFPGLTPFQILHETDIINNIIRLPSVSITSHVSFLLGVTCAFTLFWRQSKKLFSPLRFIIGALLILIYLRFIRSRQPNIKSVSKLINVSSSSKGPCYVMSNVISISNSHAGTHADMPKHFCRDFDDDASPFDDDHYTGEALIIDISDLLETETENINKGKPRAITRRIIEAAVNPSGLFSSVWRLLLVTRRLHENSDVNDIWENEFAYLEPDTVRFLSELYPLLLLIGIDTPSVDNPNTAPICEASHGELYNKGIAILENLRFNGIYPLLNNSRILRGSIMTVFNSTQSFTDSKGCHVYFFPALDI